MNKQDFSLIYLFLALKGKVTVVDHNLLTTLMKREGYDDADVKEIGRNAMNIVSAGYDDESRESIVRHHFEKYAQENDNKGNTVHNRTVLWTLINMAFSDSSYTKPKQRLVHLFAKNMNLDKSYVLEMEDAAMSLLDVIREKEFLDMNKKDKELDVLYEELIKTSKTLNEQVSTLVLLG